MLLSVFIVFASISVSLILISISLAFLISFSLVIILSISFALLNLFFNRNIKYICKSKKIEIELTIYNSCLILLLRICFWTKSFCYIFLDSKLHYQVLLLLCNKVFLQVEFYCCYCVSSCFARLLCCCYCNSFLYCC